MHRAVVILSAHALPGTCATQAKVVGSDDRSCEARPLSRITTVGSRTAPPSPQRRLAACRPSCASVRRRVYRYRRSRTERCSASGRRDACRSMRRRRWRCLTCGRRSRPSGPSPPGCARRVSSRSSMAALHAAAQGDHLGPALWTMVSHLGQTDIWTLAAIPAGKSHARDAHPMYRICYAVARYDLI